MPFEIEIIHHEPLKTLSKFMFNCWHFTACLYTFLFKWCPEEGYYISHWSPWENHQPLLTSSMSHPHAESCETLDCLTKPRDRETIDYHFSSLFSAFRHTISVHLNQTILAQNLPLSQTSHSVFAVMRIPVCMWCHWPPTSPANTLPYTCCVHKPPCSCPNPCPDETAWTSVWLPSDDLLVPSSTDKSPHKGGIDPHKTHLFKAAAYVCECVFVCIRGAMNLRATLTHGSPN